MQVDETHAQYLFVQYEEWMERGRVSINLWAIWVYMCGCVCMGVGAYRFVRAMCIVMGVKQWMDGWMDGWMDEAAGVCRSGEGEYICMGIIAGGAFGAGGFGL